MAFPAGVCPRTYQATRFPMTDWKESEPFATMRAHPRRFLWGVPLVFLVSIGIGLLFAEASLSLAIAVQLFLQTVGLLALYLPVYKRGGGGEGG